MTKKILIGAVDMKVGGIETNLINLLKNDNFRNYSIDLLLLKKSGELYEMLPKYVNIITPYNNCILDKIVHSNNLLCKLIKHLLFNYYTAFLWANKQKYDVAISYTGYYGFVDKYIAKANAKKKLIWVHTDVEQSYKMNKKYARKFNRTKNKYKQFNYIICNSEEAKKSFLKVLPNYEKKVKVVFNLITKPDINPGDIHLNGNYKIVGVGRLSREKNFGMLIEIQQRLLEKNYGTVTYLIGCGPEEEELRKIVKAKKMEKNFVFLGYQWNIGFLMQQADLLVMTSLWEAFPTVLTECLACGLPFVAPKIKGASDVFRMAPKGSYIAVDNTVESLTNGIIRAINGEVNKKFQFDWKNFNINNINKIKEIMEEK